METIVIKAGSRYQKFSTASADSVLTIGRAYSNDIIVSDPYVAAQEAELYWQEGAWYLRTLDNTNPVLLNSYELENGQGRLQSGDEIALGKSRIQVFAENHAVEPAREFTLANWLSQHRFKPLLSFAMLAVLFLSYAGIASLSVYEKMETGKVFAEALWFPVLALVWAGLWSLTGRFLRHQHYFFSHLFFTALLLTLMEVLSGLPGYINFMFSIGMSVIVLYWIISGILFGVLLSFNLSLASNLKNTLRKGLLISACIMGLFAAINYFEKDDYSNRPTFAVSIKSPPAPVFNVASIDEYVSSYDELFDKLAKEEIDQ